MDQHIAVKEFRFFSLHDSNHPEKLSAPWITFFYGL